MCIVKVLIVFPQEQKAEYETFYAIFKRLGITTSSYMVEERSEEPNNTLYKRLRESTHTLLIVSREYLSDHWLLFAAGYSLCREETSFLFIPEKYVHVPEVLKNFFRIRAYKTLEEYFSREVQRYNQEKAIEEARMYLSERGFGITEKAFIDAVVAGDRDAAERFLTLGFPADIEDDKGIPLISLAVRNGHRELTHLLLSSEADIDAVSGDNGNTPLMDATSNGFEHIVDDLLSLGSDTDIQSKNGQTALILAVGQNQAAIVEKLVGAGADVTIQDKLGMTALKYAKLFKYQDIIDTISHSVA
jgi:hypothetical protein